jgi:hypothetical protein
MNEWMLQFPVWYYKGEPDVRYEKRRNAIDGNVLKRKRSQKEAFSKGIVGESSVGASCS